MIKSMMATFGLFLLLLFSGCAHTNREGDHSTVQAIPEPSRHTSQPAPSLSSGTGKMSPSGKASEKEDTDPFDEEDPFDEQDPFDKREGIPAEEKTVEIADPIMPVNRITFWMNDKIYLWVVKPVSTGYKAVVPGFMRTGIRNFFTNVYGPVRFVHCLLQGKGESADHEFQRFVMNSTIGILGFGNPAQKYPHLEIKQEDTGQTLGRWGVGEGIYLVLPILGPSTLRDSAGKVGDYFMNPLTYVNPAELSYGASATDFLNESPQLIETYETIRGMSFDPYLAARDAYLQLRRQNIRE